MTKPFLPGMVERGYGRIVNIGSVNGSRGAFGQTNYSAAKSGVHGFTKALALEVAKRGITVNTRPQWFRRCLTTSWKRFCRRYPLDASGARKRWRTW